MNNKKQVSKKLLLAVIAIVMALFVVLIMVLFNFDSITNLSKPDISKKYDERYVTDGTYVYYRDKGYIKVEGADPDSFVSLLIDEKKNTKLYYGYASFIAGKDKNAVFIGAKKIDNLNVDSVRVLASAYITDNEQLYFKDKHIVGANPKAFEHIIGYFAKDDKNVYHKGHVLPNADLTTLDVVIEKPSKQDLEDQETLVYLPEPLHERVRNGNGNKDVGYLKDAKQVYYGEQVIEGADPDTFYPIRVEGDQWGLHYAKDKHRYYFKSKALPTVISNTGEKIDESSLRLLFADKNFGWLELFYSGANVYVFDTNEGILNLFFTRETSAPFRQITRGIYIDDKNVYFSDAKDHWVNRGRGVGRTLVGKYSIFQPLSAVKPDDFKKVADFEGASSRSSGEIYQANGVRYFHVNFLDNGASLLQMKYDGPLQQLASYKNSGLKDKEVLERLGVEQIAWQDKYTYYQELGSFMNRHFKKILLGMVVFLGMISFLVQRGWKNNRKI